jgi:hypothetical protein
MSHCALPPPSKPAHVRKAAPRQQPPACIQQAAPAQPAPACCDKASPHVHTQTQAVTVNVNYAPTPRRPVVRQGVTGPQGVRQRQQAPTAHRFNLFLFGGVSPTRYTISATSCTGMTSPTPVCTADVKRKWVPDFGAGAQVRVGDSVSLGVLGTVQGAFYGSVGFSF